jgi:Ca2+-binding RTX toxin-like protein
MTRKRRRGIRSAILGLTIAAVWMPPQPASATFACQQSGGHVFVDLNLNATGRLFVNSAGDIDLVMDGVLHPCGVSEDAALSFDVDAFGGQETFLIDQGGPGGRFSDERAWSIEMGADDDVVGVLGRAGRDRIGAGQDLANEWIDLNGDGVARHALGDTELVRLSSRGGRDRLSGQGTAGGVLDPIRLPLVLKGGGGQDVLIGGSVGDRAAGGSGNDRLLGKLGPDRLVGGTGTDVCRGGLGADSVASCEKGGP